MSQQALTKLVADSRGSILASNPAAHGTIIGIPNDFSLVVAEIYCRPCLAQGTGA